MQFSLQLKILLTWTICMQVLTKIGLSKLLNHPILSNKSTSEISQYCEDHPQSRALLKCLHGTLTRTSFQGKGSNLNQFWLASLHTKYVLQDSSFQQAYSTWIGWSKHMFFHDLNQPSGSSNTQMLATRRISIQGRILDTKKIWLQ